MADTHIKIDDELKEWADANGINISKQTEIRLRQLKKEYDKSKVLRGVSK